MATLPFIIYGLVIIIVLITLIAYSIVKNKNLDIRVLKSVADNKRVRVEAFLLIERADLARHYRAGKCDEEFFEFVVDHDNYILKILD